VDDGREVDPILLPGSERQPALDTAQDEPEVAVLDSVHEDDSRVRATSGSPLSENLGKVGDVVRDDSAPVLRRQDEDVLIFESFELRLLIERPDVVTVVSERSADASPGDVGVEKQTHRRLLGSFQEGVESPKLLERAPVRLELSFDLVREALGVGTGKPEVTVGDERMAPAKLLGVTFV